MHLNNMCKYLTNTINMSQSKCTESRALGNKSKHEISATFFAYIISMNVKEVIMGSILVGWKTGRNIKYVLNVFKRRKTTLVTLKKFPFWKHHADFWICGIYFYGRSFNHAWYTNIIWILLCWVNIDCYACIAFFSIFQNMSVSFNIFHF